MDIIQRYSNPTKYDLADYGSVSKNGDLYFIQVSKDPQTSYWLTMGNFLEVVLGGSDLSNDFIKECLDIYETKIVALKSN